MMTEVEALFSQVCLEAYVVTPLQAAFAKVAVLATCQGEPLALGHALNEFDELRTGAAPSAMPAFGRAAFGILHTARRCSLANPGVWGRSGHPEMRAVALKRMAEVPDLGRIYLYHSDGYLREAALRRLPDHPVDAALVASVMMRCNDWVPEVQTAAREALSRLSISLTPDELAALLPFALGQARSWGRGGASSVDVLAAHPAWREVLVGYFLTGTQGPLARTLRQSVADPRLDEALPRLAMQARSAHVRSVAAGFVLSGEARWATGRRWR